MEKKIFFVLLAAILGTACFGEIQTYFDDDVCEGYSGKTATIDCVYANSVGEAASIVNRFAEMSQKDGFAVTFVTKPYKNELDSVLNLIEKYYSPTAKDLYCVVTRIDNGDSYYPTAVRKVLIWFSESTSYSYWIFEAKKR